MPGWRRGGPRTSGRGRALVQSRPPESLWAPKPKSSGLENCRFHLWLRENGRGQQGRGPLRVPETAGLGREGYPTPGRFGVGLRHGAGRVRGRAAWKSLGTEEEALLVENPGTIGVKKTQIICSENVNSSTKLFGGCESGYSQRPLPRAGGPPRPLRGPNFRGAEPSAELALRGWLETLERTLKVPWS